MEGPIFWTAAVAAAVLVGMGKGGLPMVGMMAVPVLSLVISPVTAAGLLLPVFVLSDLFGLHAYRRCFDRRVVAILVAGSAAGIVVGWATAHVVTDQVVKLIVGTIGTAFVLNLALRRGREIAPRPARVAPGLFWGALAGFTSFVSHAGGPPYQVYVLPLRLSKIAFAGTSTVTFACINAMKLPPYWALGQLSLANMKAAVVLMPVAAASVFVGLAFVKVLPERLFYRLVTGALLALSLKLIWDALA